MSDTAKGIIRRLFPDKGFGFITSGTTDYFFHTSALTFSGSFGALRVGDHVTFSPTPGLRGPRAENVQVTHW